MKKKTIRNKLVIVRLTPRQLRDLKGTAKAEKMSISAVVRTALITVSVIS